MLSETFELGPNTLSCAIPVPSPSHLFPNESSLRCSGPSGYQSCCELSSLLMLPAAPDKSNMWCRNLSLICLASGPINFAKKKLSASIQSAHSFLNQINFGVQLIFRIAGSFYRTCSAVLDHSTLGVARAGRLCWSIPKLDRSGGHGTSRSGICALRSNILR